MGAIVRHACSKEAVAVFCPSKAGRGARKIW